MYTYNRILVGLQLSQLNYRSMDKDGKVFVDRLHDLAGEDLSLEDLSDDTLAEVYEYNHDLPEDVTKFLNWCVLHKKELMTLGFEFSTSYHGADDQPVIFGRYVDDLFPIPDMGADRVNFEGLEEIKKLKDSAVSLFETLDSDVLDLIRRNKLLDVWINNHSS